MKSMRSIVWVATTLCAATACDTGWGACESLFDEAACGAAWVPEQGAWEAEASAWSDASGDELWPGSDWVLEGEGDDFTVAIEGSDPASCSRTGGTYTCDPVTVDGVTVSHEGDFFSQTDATGTVTVDDGTTTATAELGLIAAWRYNPVNPDGPTTGFFQNIFGGAGYVEGSCPSRDDWDRHASWDECDDPSITGAVTIINNSDIDIGLYQTGIFYGTIPANSGAGAPVDYCVGWIMALGTTADTADCLTSFRVAPEGNTVVWPPED